VSGSAIAIVIALVATPLWDSWHYRGLRTGPGPGLAVGLILPPAAPPRQALAAGFATSFQPLQSSTVGEAHGFGGADMRRSAIRSTDAAAGSATPSATEGGAARQADGAHPDHARTDAPVAAGMTGAAHRAAAVPPQASHGQTATSQAPLSAGWLLSVPRPAVSGAPQPDPDPQPAPPPPKRLDPAPVTNDPKVVPQAIPVLSLSVPSDNTAIGQDITISVRLSGAADVTSLPFHVIFDPAVLQFVSAANGGALSGLQPVLLASVNPARPGDLAVGLSFIDAGGAFSGSGTLVELRFHALASGVSSLRFDRASVRGPISQAIEAQFENGSVSVR
jgi:hypothetical protein